jgi:probable HAF family extracellular repeat protein
MIKKRVIWPEFSNSPLTRVALMTICVAALSDASATAQTYAITDLGEVRTAALNASGQVAGDVHTPTGRRGVLVSGGVIVDLGTLGGPSSTAIALNDAGQVTGAVFPDSAGTQHAFLYSNGVMTDVGILAGGTGSTGLAINSAGDVAGMADNGIGLSTLFKYSNGVMTDLGTLGGGYARPFAINSAGQITGFSYAWDGASRAFLHSNGVMTDLGALGGSSSGGYAINDAGQITGEAYTPAETSHAFLYSNGVMTDLGTLGGTYSIGLAINRAGQVMGYSYLPGDVDVHAFLYSCGSMKDLGTLGGTMSTPFGINSRGQVVGDSYTTNDLATRPFLYSGGVMIDLNSVIPSDSGWLLIDAVRINDGGQVLGFGMHNGAPRPYLLTPVDTTTAHVQPPINADGSSVFNARRGVIPVRFTLTLNGTSTCLLPDATIAVTRTAGGAVGAVDESVYLAAADNASNFRIADCQYVYNLAASSLGAGQYRVDVLSNSTSVGHAQFSLK